MLSPAFVGRLRRSGLWGMGRKVHAVTAPATCAAIHVAVVALGPRVLPTDLVLKHIYDYRVVYVEPASIRHALHVGSWRSSSPDQRRRLTDSARTWLQLGGGWKNARRHVTRNLHGRFVADGDWDAHITPLRHRQVIAELFIEGRAPHETREYQKLRRRIEAGKFAYTHGCLTLDDLDTYFADLIRAFEAIRTSGYKTQRELGLDGSDEIRVCVDRHGRLCILSGGTHRLTIAYVLGIERVPVLIKRVHATWVHRWIESSGTTDPMAAVAHGVTALESPGQPMTTPSVSDR